MEEIDFNEEWRKHRNAMIGMALSGALYGLVIGFCLGCYC